ncbi:MAG: hypothetical protein JKY65_22955, partial [Planctomycetes bacterium]|nr:hypothetical protein [Planctomycetota bacterium]
ALPLTGVTPGRLAALAPQRGLAASTDAQRRPFVSDWKPIQEARVVEQMRARQVYEQIVRKRVDPALLEWSGGNTFQARIFPIEARGLKRIVFTFEQTLPRAGDHLRYAFPLPGDVRLGDVELFVHTKNPDALELDLPPLAGVLREPSGTPIDTDDWTRLRFVAPKGFSGALDLAFDAPGPQILTGPIPGLEGQALFARVRPQIPDRESTVPTGKALFLVDTSLSEEGVRRALASELLLEVLKRDPTISEYAVLLFDVRPRWLHAKTYRKNTPAARAETRAELAKIYLEGATNFAGLLGELASEASWTDAGKPAARFLLSDGLITWGNDKVDVLLSRHPQALKGPWFTYRFGDVAVNGALFAKLSRLSEGRTVNVLSAEQLPAAAIAHRKVPVRLEAVRLEGGHEFVVAGDPELVFPGQTLDVAARFAPGEKPSHLEVVLEIEGVRHLQRIPVQTGSSVLAARAWAELWVGRLLALDDERLQRRVVALSQAFGLANKAASLLILEDDAEWVAHELETEPLDLAHFAGLRAAEESGRLDLLQGIQMDSVSEDGRALVLALLRSKLPPLQRGLPLMDRPLAGGLKRLTDEVSYRKARSADALDVKAYDRIARARAIAGDTCGAVRGLSCVVEKRPRSAEANRLVGYACLALGQYGPAAELFERVRLTRPFEGQSFLEEALALEALGRFGEAARNFEIVLARSFPRDQAQIRTTARYHYARMLADLLLGGGIEGELEARLTARKAGLETKPGEFARTALQLSIHWNTDGTDVDLWVVEPEGERCYFSNRSTKAGGRLFWDTTTGYGPELYRRVQCEAEGSFDVLLHYYGNNGQRWEVPTAVLCVRDFDVFGTQGPSRRQFKMRILPKSSAVIRLGRERP